MNKTCDQDTVLCLYFIVLQTGCGSVMSKSGSGANNGTWVGHQHPHGFLVRKLTSTTTTILILL